MTRSTPLAERHRALGARLIEFAGWEMPLQYSGIVDEHRAVRQRVGLFDLSHMGELWVEGQQAGDALSYALVSDPASLAPGRAQYSMLCAPDGGILDDLIVYRLPDDGSARRYLVVANAANADADRVALEERAAGFDAEVVDRSSGTALVAIQGPLAEVVLEPLCDAPLDGLRYYGIVEVVVAGVPALVARTGYTGEDGFEVFVSVEAAEQVWDVLARKGAAAGLQPVGLGARDTLRLEAGMPLYGNELDRSTDPYEAGLGRVVKPEKAAGFVGQEALSRSAAVVPTRRLVGLRVVGRGIARHGHPITMTDGGEAIGRVTSGTMSPTLGVPIAMGYVASAEAEPGTMVAVDIRAAPVPAEVVPLPFYRRPRTGA